MTAKSKRISNEAKVGALVLGTGVLAALFAWMIGAQNPFGDSIQFYVTYQFAGGIEVGSPVRVSGIKVGRVEKIEFFTDGAGADSPLVPVKLRVSVRKDAARGVRADSKFFVNIAGIIGERYVEITPGTSSAAQVTSGQTMVGIDPPRIDQLLSQSFDLAGRIKEIIDENKGDIARSIDLLLKLSANINQTLGWVDKSKFFKTDLSALVNNLIEITGDVRKITDQFHSKEGEKTLKLLHELLWRLEPLNSEEIRKFMQKEGVRIKMF